jgi:ornithine cyclodeaminase/alanine dehydrogenase-like protein (mu-crystallin family)
MRYLSATDLADLIAPADLVTAIEQSLRDFAQDKVIVPNRQHVDFRGNTLLTMPVIGEDAFGTKIVSVVPSNAQRHLPVINGLMTLSDGVTGAPLAVFNAAAFTAQRTGAVGAVGLKYISPPEVDRVGIIGAGVQGAWQAIFACAVRSIHTIYFVARSDEKARQFIDTVSSHVPSVRFLRCADADELLSKTQVVVAATTSSSPVLPADCARLENKHFVSVGSFKPSMTEFPYALYQLAPQVIVDSDRAKYEVGDLIDPLSSGLLHETKIIHLADVVVGRRSLNTAGTTVFKSVGMALYDLYAARAFFAEAQRLDRGTSLA